MCVIGKGCDIFPLRTIIASHCCCNYLCYLASALTYVWNMMSRKGCFTLLLTVNSCWKWHICGLATFICGNNSRFCVEFAWRLVCMTSTECACAEGANVHLQYKAEPEDITLKNMSFGWNNKTHSRCWACVGALAAGNKQVLQNDSEFLFSSETPDQLSALLNECATSAFPCELQAV